MTIMKRNRISREEGRQQGPQNAFPSRISTPLVLKKITDLIDKQKRGDKDDDDVVVVALSDDEESPPEEVLEQSRRKKRKNGDPRQVIPLSVISSKYIEPCDESSSMVVVKKETMHIVDLQGSIRSHKEASEEDEVEEEEWGKDTYMTTPMVFQPLTIQTLLDVEEGSAVVVAIHPDKYHHQQNNVTNGDDDDNDDNGDVLAKVMMRRVDSRKKSQNQDDDHPITLPIEAIGTQSSNILRLSLQDRIRRGEICDPFATESPTEDDESPSSSSLSFVSNLSQGGRRLFSKCHGRLFQQRSLQYRMAQLQILSIALDDIRNVQFIHQSLQLHIPFLTGHEAYWLHCIMEAMEDIRQRKTMELKSHLDNLLRSIFQNSQNLANILLQACEDQNQRQQQRQRQKSFHTSDSSMLPIVHWHQAVVHNRKFDILGRIPILGRKMMIFPPNENNLSTGVYVWKTILEKIRCLYRRVNDASTLYQTINRAESLSVQNLTGLYNGDYTEAYRSIFGTYFGRQHIERLRMDHGITTTPTSILHMFMTQPMSTLVNHGAVSTLRALDCHWNTLLNAPYGSFTHCRLELLDPFQTVRFFVPIVCIALASLRGWNRWDAEVLGPFLQTCQNLKESLCVHEDCKALVLQMQKNMLLNLSAGVSSVYDPLNSWLTAIAQACDLIGEEAREVYAKVTSVELGVRLGYDVMSSVVYWNRLPAKSDIEHAIMLHLKGKTPMANINERRIRTALSLTTPKDKRTLTELVKRGHEETPPARLLLSRVTTLVQRAIRREALNEAIRELSLGDQIQKLIPNQWYWLEEREKRGAYIYRGKVKGKHRMQFIHVDSGLEKTFPKDGSVQVRAYVPVAEAVSRAQKVFMSIELDHSAKFSYAAFMEFTSLRVSLQRLALVSQIFCDEVDHARFNILDELQRSNRMQIKINDLEVGKTYYQYNKSTNGYDSFVCEKEYTSADPEWYHLAQTKIYKIAPQSISIIGGAWTGLISALHCAENVLMSGGKMKIIEEGGYDASNIEQAQIVRLDSRWTVMLRYYLGTSFEDACLSTAGKTDSQFANLLPAHGCLEIPMNCLNNILYLEITKMWSKGLIEYFPNSQAKYCSLSNSLVKHGQHLKAGDRIFWKLDANGVRVAEQITWKVIKTLDENPLAFSELQIGQEYGVLVNTKNAVLPFKLASIDLKARMYTFRSLKKDVSDIVAVVHNLPFVYLKRNRRNIELSKVILECTIEASDGTHRREELPMVAARNQNFSMDIGHTHVISCVGNADINNLRSRRESDAIDDRLHGVCSLSGLKVSLKMHNLGERRLVSDLLDRFRFIKSGNTRIIGDAIKSIRHIEIGVKMLELIKTKNWQTYFQRMVEASKFVRMSNWDLITPEFRQAARSYSMKIRKQKNTPNIQVTLYETVDNLSLTMELPYVYRQWKKTTAARIIGVLEKVGIEILNGKRLTNCRDLLMNGFDHLWYQACFEVIRLGNVYSPVAYRQIPKLSMINSCQAIELSTLETGESFRLEGPTEDTQNYPSKIKQQKKNRARYDVLVKKKKHILVRNEDGGLTQMNTDVMVLREGDLCRSKNANSESQTAITSNSAAGFFEPKLLRSNFNAEEYVYSFFQTQSPSELIYNSNMTAACVNANSMNTFVKRGIDGKSIASRSAQFADEISWSRNEVQASREIPFYDSRSLGLFHNILVFVRARISEVITFGQPVDSALSSNCIASFARVLVPKGMENNQTFIASLYKTAQEIFFQLMIKDIKTDVHLMHNAKTDNIVDKIRACKELLSDERTLSTVEDYWEQFGDMLKGIETLQYDRLKKIYIKVAKHTEEIFGTIVKSTIKKRPSHHRFTGHMPRSVDSFVNDFTIEAQKIANFLLAAAVFSASALVLTLFAPDVFSDDEIANSISFVFCAIAIVITFVTMTNVRRYRIINEESRGAFNNEKLSHIKMTVFACLPLLEQERLSETNNPFRDTLHQHATMIQDSFFASDLNSSALSTFNDSYAILCEDITSPLFIRKFHHTCSCTIDLYNESKMVDRALFKILEACELMIGLMETDLDRDHNAESTKSFFFRLQRFTPRLESSLKYGHIFGGCGVSFAAIRFLWSLLWCASARFTIRWAPIENETLGILHEFRRLSAAFEGAVLFKREICLVENLYWATRESSRASLIFVLAFFLHVSSWIHCIIRIISYSIRNDKIERTGMDFAAWSSVIAIFAAAVTAFHFQEKLQRLLHVFRAVRAKRRRGCSMDVTDELTKVKFVAATQMILTFLRLVASCGVVVAIFYSIADLTSSSLITNIGEIPLWSGLVSMGALVVVFIISFGLHFGSFYNANPQIGSHLCEAFRLEIEGIYETLIHSMPTLNDVGTTREDELEIWDYVAQSFLHKYRFDNLFDADRLGTLVQYIRSGMESRQ